MPPHAAGILSDYSHLKPDPNREGTWSYVDKTVDIRPYTKLYFDPVKVIATPSPEQSELPPDVVQRMSAKLLASFEKPLSPAYQVVSAPGPDVLRVRTAITGIQAVKPPLHATDFIPIKALYDAGRAAAGEAPRIEEMSAEAQLLDPQGRIVAEGLSNRKGNKTLPQHAQITWQDLTAITEHWGVLFKQRLDSLRGDTR